MGYVAEGFVRYAKPDPKDPTGNWIIRNVSERGLQLDTGDDDRAGGFGLISRRGHAWLHDPATSRTL